MDNFSPVQLDLSQLNDLPQKLRELGTLSRNRCRGFLCRDGAVRSVEEFSYDRLKA